jgi:hypothetical protein
MFNVGDDEHCWWLSQVVRTYLPEMRHFFLPFSSPDEGGGNALVIVTVQQ